MYSWKESDREDIQDPLKGRYRLEAEQGYRYKSRRNCVQRVQSERGFIVQKLYRDEDSCDNELRIYRMLQGSELPHADIIRAEPLQLSMTWLPGKNLVEILEEQEDSGEVNWSVWEKLVGWLIDFYQLTGLVMTDVNLRNFLWDGETGTVFGVDFEECAEGGLITTAASLVAYIQTYAPEKTPLKQEISDYILQIFSWQLWIPFRALIQETQKQEVLLRMRRKKRI